MNPVRTALMGVTHPHSISHLKTLNASSLVSDVVLLDPDGAAAEAARSAHGGKVTALYTDLEELLSNEELGFAIALGRNDLNARLCLRVIDAGVHVLSEKPIGCTAAEVEQVVEAAGERDLRLGVMYQNRYHPISQDVRRLIGEGVLGRVTGCEARLITSQVQFRNPDHWLFKKDLAGGGILSWLGCHYIDLLSYVMDDPVEGVSAMVATLSGEAIDVEDVATLSLRFRSGVLGSLQAGYQLALSKGGYVGPSYDTYMSVRGTEGRLWWEPASGPSRLYIESGHDSVKTAPGRTIDYSLPRLDAYGGVYGLSFLDDFILSTSGQVEVPAGGGDALAVARVVEGAYESSGTGRHVTVR